MLLSGFHHTAGPTDHAFASPPRPGHPQRRATGMAAAVAGISAAKLRLVAVSPQIPRGHILLVVCLPGNDQCEDGLACVADEQLAPTDSGFE